METQRADRTAVPTLAIQVTALLEMCCPSTPMVLTTPTFGKTKAYQVRWNNIDVACCKTKPTTIKKKRTQNP